ncbi:MAG: hypothetical protein MJ244_00070 [Clostridia bacterium]|nr:hypothetical protein [Clostridia bacterium]
MNEEGNYSIEASIVLPLMMIFIITIITITIYIFNGNKENLISNNSSLDNNFNIYDGINNVKEDNILFD